MKNDVLDFPLEIKKEDVTDEGFFKGFASVFGGPPDSYGDVVAPGAFRDTIAAGGRNGNGIALLWQHDATQPVGIWNVLEERKKGLYAEGQLAIDTMKGGDAHKLLRMGAVKGLSIGFNTKKYEIDQKKKIRTLKEVELWEISLVTFPASTRARVMAVKAIEEAKTVREMENALRESGLSKNLAVYVAGLCAPSLRESGKVDDAGMNVILASLRSTNRAMELTNALI